MTGKTTIAMSFDEVEVRPGETTWVQVPHGPEAVRNIITGPHSKSLRFVAFIESGVAGTRRPLPVVNEGDLIDRANEYFAIP